jgi:MFS transporter, NNP family, nitrate/nitrite transporter
VPFINPRAIGAVSGIVGAGGNLGAVAAGLLLNVPGLDWRLGLFLLGVSVSVISFLSFAVTFGEEREGHLPAMRTERPLSLGAGLPQFEG